MASAQDRGPGETSPPLALPRDPLDPWVAETGISDAVIGWLSEKCKVMFSQANGARGASSSQIVTSGWYWRSHSLRR